MERNRAFALLLSLLVVAPWAAYADPGTTTAPGADVPSSGTATVAPATTYAAPLPQQPASLTVDPRVTALLEERARFHRGIPIAMIAVGGTVAAFGGMFLGFANLGAAMSEEPNPQKPDLTGEYVAWAASASAENFETRTVDPAPT